MHLHAVTVHRLARLIDDEGQDELLDESEQV